MAEIDPQFEHQTINSLVTKIVLMVFLGSFASAALVSWASIKPARESLTRSIEERYLGAAQHATESASAWLSAGREELARLTSPPWDGARESALAELLRKSHYFEGLALCDSRTADSSGAGSTPTCPPAIDGSFAESEWMPIPLSSGVVVPATSVLVSGEDESRVFAVGVFDRERLALLLAEHLPHPDGAMLLTTEAGSVLAGAGSETPTQIEAPNTDAEESNGIRESENAPWPHTVSAVHPLGDSGWFFAL